MVAEQRRTRTQSNLRTNDIKPLSRDIPEPESPHPTKTLVLVTLICDGTIVIENVGSWVTLLFDTKVITDCRPAYLNSGRMASPSKFRLSYLQCAFCPALNRRIMKRRTMAGKSDRPQTVVRSIRKRTSGKNLCLFTTKPARKRSKV